MYTRHKEAIDWFSKKIKINERFVGGTGHFFPRGAVVSVSLGENIGFEKAGIRPALCISNDTNNRKNGNVAVIPLTDLSNKGGRPLLPTQFIMYKSKYSFLRLDSIVQCEDMRIVSKARIGNVLGFISKTDLQSIEKRIKTFLAL